MPGKGAFKRCVEEVSARGGVRSPAGVCATAGRKKYGAQKFQQMAAAGRRRSRKNTALDEALDQVLSFSPVGSALKAVEQQREKLQRKMARETKKSNAGRGSWRKTVKRTKKALRRLGVSDWDAPIQSKREFKKSRRNAERLRQLPTTAKHPTPLAVPASWFDRRKKGKRKNPRNPVGAAQARYESFHGRPSEELIEITTPIHEHSVVSGIGELRKLVVIAPDGRIVTIKNFGVNRAGQMCILSQNEEATQLFIDGGDQSVNLEDFGILEPYHEWETLGEVRNVYYFTTKDHLGDDGGTATYNHKFGGIGEFRTSTGRKVRRRSRKPTLIYDVRNRLLYFSGGGYTLPDEGIAN